VLFNLYNQQLYQKIKDLKTDLAVDMRN